MHIMYSLKGYRRDNRRRDLRIPADLAVEVDGCKGRIVDLSLGGFSITGRDFDFERGDEITAKIDFGNGDVMTVAAEISRFRFPEIHGASFKNLDKAGYDIVEAIVSGKRRARS